MRQVLEYFLAIPAMVPAGEDVDAVLQEVVGDFGGDAEAGGGVFAIGDDQVDLALRDEIGETIANDLAAGGAYDVPDKENAHG